jgi:hypothetical protein
MGLFRKEVHSQAPHYERFAQMDLEALPPDAVADPAIRNAILLSRQKMAERAARVSQPPRVSGVRRGLERFERFVNNRRSRFGGMALVAALALGSISSLANNDEASEAAFQPSQPAATTPETTTTTHVKPIPLETSRESVAEAQLENVVAADQVQEQRIFIRAGGTLWWEVDDLFASVGLAGKECREVATRGIVTALRTQTGSDLNNLYAGQDFAVPQSQINEQLQIAAQNPACVIDS